MAGLVGLQVVELGGGTVGAVLGALLADQGADVVVVAGEGDLPVPYQGWGRGKTFVNGPVEELIRHADVVIDAGALPRREPRPPSAVWCRLHGGGLPPVEDLVAARTGLHEAPLGLRPRFHDVPIATMVAAGWGANGIMGALLARRRDGRGQSVRVSLTDAAITATELLAFFTDRPPRAFQPLQWVASPFVNLHPCGSGYLFVHLGLPHHLASFLEGLGEEGDPLRAVLSDATLADPGSMGGVREAIRATRALRALLATADAKEWEARFPDLCLAAVRSVEEWVASEHAQQGGQVVKLDGQRVPGALVQTEGTVIRPSTKGSIASVLERWSVPKDPWADDRRPPLAGVRVLDMTAVIAGPVASRTLAELGAEVVRVDNPWMRPAWMDAFHALFDRNKKSVWMDLSVPSARARFDVWVAAFQPDLLVENFRPGVAERLGLQRVAPHVLSMSAFGSRGDWGTRPGWEQTVQAACGMQDRYGEEGPELFPTPVHDLCTGLFGAFGALVALYGGGSAHTDLARSATWLLAHASFGEAVPEDRWVKEGGWHYVKDGYRLERTSAKRAWAESPLVVREERSDLGAFTRINSPLHLSRTPIVEGASRPRGWATEEVLGVEGAPSSAQKMGRRAWWRGRIRWALGVAAVRLLP